MFNIESNWGRAAVTEMSEVIINKNKPPHDALLHVPLPYGMCRGSLQANQAGVAYDRLLEPLL